MFTKKDLELIDNRGSSVEGALSNMNRYKVGFPWLKIVSAATPQRGIIVLNEQEVDAAQAYYENAKIEGKTKFVPASGAASRMFKDLYTGLALSEKGNSIEGLPAEKFADNIKDFPFYDENLYTNNDPKEILSKTLTEEGLNYGAKPKGVLKFHQYPDGEVRTAFAEHLVEAQDYMRNADSSANIVVTISPEHQSLFDEALEDVKQSYEQRYGLSYNINFTYQDKATDSLAADMNNEPFRTDDDELLFRPAGHGALIHNLNKIEDEIVSIKNIDNVSTERFLPIISTYKKVLLGKCLELRDKIHAYLRALDAVSDAESAGELMSEIESFLDSQLCIKMAVPAHPEARLEALRLKLDRPIRVCGMVKNEGEPGGGPFIIEGKDGSTSLQILESVQINESDKYSCEALKSATHFNPVDLVCCLKNYKGESFDLLKFVDEETGFISCKSYQGRELKALELPGLWNGAMSDWNTAFVEVPLETFNPVKVVMDLLRPAHKS